MIINEIEYTLKDGRKALIRNPKEEDVQGMLDYLYVSAGETDFLLRYPEECKKYTAENEIKLFQRMNEASNGAMLVCVVDGKVAGNCQITWSEGIKTRHRAEVAIALLSEFWNQGIGTRFMEELIRIAEENKYIMQIELEYVEGNVRARTLYEKMGFRIVGVKPNAIRLKDGTLLNEYSMIREIFHSKEYNIRPIRENEVSVLEDFLYEAIFIPEGVKPPAREIIYKPELQVYFSGFGRKGDICLVAEINEKIVGAVWVRIMNDYGHIDDDTPSVAISLYKEYRNLGIGTALMEAMIQRLKTEGYQRVSLAVQKANYAVKMYEKVGFFIVDENDEEYIMVCQLETTE